MEKGFKYVFLEKAQYDEPIFGINFSCFMTNL